MVAEQGEHQTLPQSVVQLGVVLNFAIVDDTALLHATLLHYVVIYALSVYYTDHSIHAALCDRWLYACIAYYRLAVQAQDCMAKMVTVLLLLHRAVDAQQAEHVYVYEQCTENAYECCC
jgi:hypothetical protein